MLKGGEKEIKAVMQEVQKAADAGQRGGGVGDGEGTGGEGGRWEGPPPTLENRPVGLPVRLGDTSLLNELSRVKQQEIPAQ